LLTELGLGTVDRLCDIVRVGSTSDSLVRELQTTAQHVSEQIHTRCSDTSVAIRKQAMTALTELMRSLHHAFDSEAILSACSFASTVALASMSAVGKSLRSSWLAGCMPLAADPEVRRLHNYIHL